MADALYICDAEGKILMCNKTHCNILGYKREEIVGTSLPYPWVDTSDNLKLERGLKLFAKEGFLRNYTLTWRRRDNKTIVTSLALSSLAGHPHQPQRYVISVRDVTDIRFADELRRANDQIHRLVIEVKRKAVRLQTLQEMNSLVLHNSNVSRIFKSITSGVSKLVEHDLAGIYIHDPERQCFIPHTLDRKSTRLNSSHIQKSRMPSSA